MGQVTTEAAPTGRSAPSRGWLVLLLLCLAQFMAILDIMVVNVALPTIGAHLHLGRDVLTWVITAYTVVFGGLLILGGRLADTLGRKNMFLTGVSVFTVASLISGLSGSGGMLLTGRAFQGLGAAMLSPAALSVIMTEFTGKERNRALGIWAAISAGGAAIGFVVGGALTSGPGWQWVFFINLPVGALVLALAPSVVPRRLRNVGNHLDLPGAVTGTGAVALIIYGLIDAGNNGWASTGAVLPIVLGLLLAVVFVLIERRTDRPLVPLSLIRKPPLPGAVGIMAMTTAVLLGSYFITSLYLQDSQRYSPIHAGLIFLPVAVATGIGAHFGTAHMPKIGPRPVTGIGMLLSAAGLSLMAAIGTGGGVLSQLLPPFLLVGLGSGMTFVSAITSGLSSAAADDAGVASGVLNTGHELGASLGIAVLSTVAASSISVHGALRGFEHAYIVVAIISVLVAAAAMVLLPKGALERGEGPMLLH
jgi:EmrB/QacA subfamily drug resistance transporter